VETSVSFALAESYGGYSTNLPLEDLTDGKAWIAYRYDGADPSGDGLDERRRAAFTPWGTEMR
jgi:hypothetical protein